MAPKYKLTYFEFTGLAEPVRLLFAYGGIEYVDNRVSQSEWPKIKPTFPLHVMPTLEFDGKVLHQSLAITRFAAKQVGLAGDNDVEACEIDSVADTLNEFRKGILDATFEPNEERKKLLKEKLDNETLPFQLGKLDAWAKENNGYFANKKLSWADVYFYAIVGLLGDFHGRDLIVDYPNLQGVVQNVEAIPAIKKWIENRPANNHKF